MPAQSRSPKVLQKEQLPVDNQADTATFLHWDSREGGCGEKPVSV